MVLESALDSWQIADIELQRLCDGCHFSSATMVERVSDEADGRTWPLLPRQVRRRL